MSVISSTRAEHYVEKRTARGKLALVRIIALVLLFSASALYESVHLSSLSDNNVWVHLRTGAWMLQTHSVPHNGLFSQYSTLPWMDSSWGYDVVLAACYRMLGLRALPLLLMFFKAGLALLTFWLATEAKATFWAAVSLSAIAQYVIPISQSLPYALSVIFFGIELLLLESSRRTGNVKPLYALPALFLLWANLHALFLLGLVLLILFVVSTWIESWPRRSAVNWLDREIRPLARKPVLIASACCLLAAMVNPYAFRVFSAAYRTLYSAAGFSYFGEMRAMSFRQPQNYALMLLIMSAFLALGRRRSLRVFELLALTAATLLGFRIQREAWMAALIAVAILADATARIAKDRESQEQSRAWWEHAACAVVVTAILVLAALRLPHQDSLQARVSQSFPVKACDFIRDHALPQPLFNEYTWGSFLTWYLPEYPVAIDSRMELYGDELTEGYFKVIAGGERLDAYPALGNARTLLLQKQSGIVKALTTLPALSSQYRLAYSDDLGAVFTRQP
jgi:hypothetical protein